MTGRTHHHINPMLGTEAFARFLRPRLCYYRGKRLLVIHDRAAQHDGGPIDTVRRAVEGRLLLKPQPAYSTELNPRARIWKRLRRVVTHNHWFESFPKEVKAVQDFFCYLPGCKEQVQHFCAVKTPESLVALL
jgi:hypothetical protein